MNDLPPLRLPAGDVEHVELCRSVEVLPFDRESVDRDDVRVLSRALGLPLGREHADLVRDARRNSLLDDLAEAIGPGAAIAVGAQGSAKCSSSPSSSSASWLGKEKPVLSPRPALC